MRTALHALAFIAFLALWTWKLLQSQPVPEGVSVGLSSGVKFGLAKSLHVCAYAFLTVLGGSLARRLRWWVVVLLVLHAIGTEIGQTFVPHRSGTVMDVLIDCCGIAGGLWAQRAATRRCSPPFAP